MLNRLFQKGFQAAKWARTNTGISKGQVNLGNVLCELARRIFGKVAACRLLVVGAGEVAPELARQNGVAAADFHDRRSARSCFNVALSVCVERPVPDSR